MPDPTMIRVFVLMTAVLQASVFSISSEARDVQNLYRMTVPVSDRSDGERSRGASRALSQVLVKLTGNRRIRSTSRVAGLLKNASNLMVQYGYELEALSGSLMLAAEFDEVALAKELDALGVSVWAKERPDTIAWIVIDELATRELLGGDEPGRLGETMLTRAEVRGIPILLPVMDVEESKHLIYAGDWEGLAGTALALSWRYGTPSILIGYLRQSVPGFWDVRWKIHVGDESFEWQAEGDIPELILEDGVDALGDALARRFADPVMLALADRFELTVFGMQSVDDYARVMHYLESLDAVTGLFVRSVDNRRILFELDVQGGRPALTQGISFGQVLTPVVGQSGAYKLLP
ncbi:MAG: DUF2066 domain-containing protein [Gammaproteobacteria bacterium]